MYVYVWYIKRRLRIRERMCTFICVWLVNRMRYVSVKRQGLHVCGRQIFTESARRKPFENFKLHV